MRTFLTKLRQTLFGDSARAFGTLGVILLLSLAVVPLRDQLREWSHYQKQYLKLIAGRADAVALRRRFESGIHQIYIPKLGVVDRCTTCHTGMQEASLRDVRAQPLNAHPSIPHSLNEFGCVMCHGGQGAATTVEEAHRGTKAWDRPMLAARYVESSCGQCHLNRSTGTSKLNAGRSLLASYGCVRCHVVALPDGVKVAATDDPPELTHIADKTTREWIFGWLKNPQSYSATATMPNYQFKDDELRDISAFLISQSTPLPGGPAAPAAPGTPDAAALQAGASVYGESFCASCHAVQNAAGLMVGGTLGPELTRIGTKARPAWLAQWVGNPKLYDPGTAMPHYRFDAKQVALVTGFLESKADPDWINGIHLDPATDRQIARGKKLVSANGCTSCHQINGVPKTENFAPELTSVGSLPLVKALFKPDMEHSLPVYIEAKIRDPRSLGPGLKMPQFSLSTPQVEALTTALLAQTERARTLPPAMRVAGVYPTLYEPSGEAGRLMRDLNCFACHAIDGRGGDMAPDLSWEGTSVQRDWLFKFMKNPNTLRPALIRRMPKFNLDDHDAGVIADYLMTVYQTPAFDRDEPLAGSDPADAENGKQLFYSKYECQSCHIVDAKQDKGYVGPTLTAVGSRLNAAWIFHWLKAPASLRAKTLEPNWSMSDTDARELTAFLVAQKGQSAKAGSKP